MDLFPESKRGASPFATGGGGSDYERYVGAYYLAGALLRSIPRGQDAGITREARFQRLYAGEPLDDLIIVSDLPVGEAKLALQIKRDLTFGKASQVFDDVIRACWETFTSPIFTPGLDRFGIILGLYSKTIDEHYQSVLTWARNSTSAHDFLSRIARAGSHKTQRDFVVLVQGKLQGYRGGSSSDEDLWRFLRSMVLLHFDFQHSGSRDQAYIVEAIGHILPLAQKAESPRLFAQLFQYAAEANRTAGSLDTITLRQKLLSDGFSLLDSSDCRADLERVHEHTRFILGDIRTDIAGLILNRTAVVAEAREKMQTSRLLELIGPPGAGKSAILKMLVECSIREPSIQIWTI